MKNKNTIILSTNNKAIIDALAGDPSYTSVQAFPAPPNGHKFIMKYDPPTNYPPNSLSTTYVMPCILRALRSRYLPHMGLKQQTKLLRKQSALIPNTP